MSSWFDIIYEPPIKFGEPYPLFNRVSLETSSRCNRRCPFCPISLGVRDFPQTLMTNDTFYKIVTELQALQLEHNNLKCIELFRLNEPLLDQKYTYRIKMIRDCIPRVTIYCATNGDILLSNFHMDKAVVKMMELQAAGLNVISIDIYDDMDSEAILKFFKDMIVILCKSDRFATTTNRYQQHSLKRLHIALTDMRGDTKRVTESWTNCGMRKITAPKRFCPRPMRHFPILYDGSVPVCCVVNPGDESIARMGNVNDNTIVEIWNSPKFHMYRMHLQDKDRGSLPGCDTCDARVAYAHVFRRVE